jgi:hypothetical protein
MKYMMMMIYSLILIILQILCHNKHSTAKQKLTFVSASGGLHSSFASALDKPVVSPMLYSI